ncbi:KilA-N domain-containing protein, partial [Nitrosomonas communis]|uniref:KilA-N domain-containing protein n=1 Tax=Nitrosomonas communis TaxID=44574 RepID=UPI003D2E1980
MTSPFLQAYPFHATEKNVGRFDSLSDRGDEPQSLCDAAFLLPCVPSMGGLGGEPQGSPERSRSVNPSMLRPPLLTEWKVVRTTNRRSHIMTELTVLTTKIRQLDGLYSLNDLHKAAGGEDKHRPTYFLRNEQTQELIAELSCADSHIIPTKTVNGKGKQQGTYVCKELVIAYAAWISAAFHLKVIRVFLEQVNPEATQAEQIAKQVSKHLQRALPSQDCLLPEHQAKEILDRLYRLCQLFHPF